LTSVVLPSGAQLQDPTAQFPHDFADVMQTRGHLMSAGELLGRDVKSVCDGQEEKLHFRKIAQYRDPEASECLWSLFRFKINHL
jgi:hypothetical protein